jgi:hypothetical protein
MKHRMKWEKQGYGVNNPNAYVICCSSGLWIEAKTRADALTLLREHQESGAPPPKHPPDARR